MKSPTFLKDKIVGLGALQYLVSQWKEEGLRVVFTNGCFDLLHRGHIDYLSKAAALGDKFIIGLNSDESVSALKGEHRPLQDEVSRAIIMSALAFTDAVCIFNEDTPAKMIRAITPHVMVKGGDYQVREIAGGSHIMKSGGSVVILPFLPGYSTSAIEQKIIKSNQP
ncbi:MAG: D-glycero-beta-D-manno-heptose 1-phosphate adenylyltransferase [Bacteroidia bacterium]